MSLPVTSEDAVYRNSELEALARAVKPARVRSKKGKRFADGSFMLSLADQINRREEERIQGLLQEEVRGHAWGRARALTLCRRDC